MITALFVNNWPMEKVVTVNAGFEKTWSTWDKCRPSQQFFEIRLNFDRSEDDFLMDNDALFKLFSKYASN